MATSSISPVLQSTITVLDRGASQLIQDPTKLGTVRYQLDTAAATLRGVEVGLEEGERLVNAAATQITKAVNLLAKPDEALSHLGTARGKLFAAIPIADEAARMDPLPSLASSFGSSFVVGL